MRLLTYFSISFVAAVAAANKGAEQWSGWGQCPPAVVALATGIHLNIVGQVTGEAPGIKELQIIEASSPVNQTAFLIAKGELISTIMGGIKIRDFNLAIAPAGNAALPGLAQYAAAQEVELGLSESLTGVPSHDLSILSTLASDVAAGTQLNMRNLANATEGCSLGLVFPANDV